MTNEEVTERVTRGAALLDEKSPGWAGRINLESLNCEIYCFCILGQIYRTYWNGARKLFPSGHNDWDAKAVEAFGFYTNGSYPMLQDAWIVAIADRVVPKTQVQAEAEAVPVGAAR